MTLWHWKWRSTIIHELAEQRRSQIIQKLNQLLVQGEKTLATVSDVLVVVSGVEVVAAQVVSGQAAAAAELTQLHTDLLGALSGGVSGASAALQSVADRLGAVTSGLQASSAALAASVTANAVSG